MWEFGNGDLLRIFSFDLDARRIVEVGQFGDAVLQRIASLAVKKVLTGLKVLRTSTLQ